ncbi:hypothetical protein [Sinosporangium siamense]|uniref:Uncharacterized protein n=1 Tax=Sinosporangium siamense TaxID=1367973 RepID=A0A919V8Q3_9ACTN|nr:hypothetical protein [Sinosporangium siamense]GII96375.1 hypothetical protein Ssi02_66060 [Sinosporangium siamense]
MSSPLPSDALLKHLDERCREAQEEVDRLTSEIAGLTDRLAGAGQLLTRLELTRQTLVEIAGQHTAPEPAAAALPPAYQDVLAAITRAGEGLRAKEVCLALGLDLQHKTVESIRSKLKRLVGRDLLIEPEPGLFVLNRRRN